MFNQISNSTYLNDLDKWMSYIVNYGGLEICDDDTGEVIQTITSDDVLKDTKGYPYY